MKPFALVALVVSAASLSAQAPSTDLARWTRQAQGITIVRDDWGIAHVHGKTDADAVFGDDLRAGRGRLQPRRDQLHQLAWAGWPRPRARREIYRDLRMKLFIDPDAMKAQYAASPAWLKTLMDAWADGLNYYLVQASRGEAARDHALRAVDGADVQRGQHRRRHRAA